MAHGVSVPRLPLGTKITVEAELGQDHEQEVWRSHNATFAHGALAFYEHHNKTHTKQNAFGFSRRARAFYEQALTCTWRQPKPALKRGRSFELCTASIVQGDTGGIQTHVAISLAT